MKRIYTLIVLLGLAMGLFTGCSQSSDSSTPPAAPATNTPPAGTNA